MNPSKKISLILSLFILVSCYNSLDFDQLDDYAIKPVFTSSLTYFTVTQAQFFGPDGIQVNIDDFSAFEIFENDLVRENVVKIDFNAEMRNEFDRDAFIEIEFLDDNEDVVYRFTRFVIQENTNLKKFVEEISINDNPDILNTSKVRINAALEDTGIPLNANDTSEFEFKSSITFYMESSL